MYVYLAADSDFREVQGSGLSLAPPFKSAYQTLPPTSIRPLCLIKGDVSSPEEHRETYPARSSVDKEGTMCSNNTTFHSRQLSAAYIQRPAWKHLVSRSSPLSPRSALSACSHKSLGLCRLHASSWKGGASATL